MRTYSIDCARLARILSMLLASSGILISCDEKKTAGGGPGSANTTSAGVTGAVHPTPGETKAPVVVPDIAPLDHPASGYEAAKVINLTTFPLPEGTEAPRRRSIASLTYESAKGVQELYDFQKKTLTAQRWTELPGATVTAEYASGVFQRAGFTVSVSVTPLGAPGKGMVILTNHGNVDLTKLPLPAGTTPMYSGPVSSMRVAPEGVEATLEACRKLLMAEGWELYGGAGDSHDFKKNAVLLKATIQSAPAQGGKTMITYSTQQLPVDIPVPADVEDLRPSDSNGTTRFDTAATKEVMAQYYKDALGKLGWKPNYEELLKGDDNKYSLIFRNPEKDLLWIDFKEVPDSKLGVVIKYQTAAELAEEEKRFQEFKKKNEEKRKAEEAAAGK